MKSFTIKTQIILMLILGAFSHAQKPMQTPGNTVFYMEVNGKQLNKKINWEKFNPILKEISSENGEKASWNDYSKTGIKYDATQYHYATVTDSLQTYNTHFTLDNKDKFQEFINSLKKKGLEVTRKNKYSYVDLENDLFVAWNDQRAVLSMLHYEKPPKRWSDEDIIAIDSSQNSIDSAAAVTIDSIYAEAKPFDYKEEIKYLKDDIVYLKQSIKDSNAEILKIQKDIQYLEKHHKYPDPQKESPDSTYSDDADIAIPPPVSNENYYEEEDDDEAYASFRKELDSLNREKYKILKKFAEASFDTYFNSNLELQTSQDLLKFRDAEADLFITADYGKIFNDKIYKDLFQAIEYSGFLTNLYNTTTSYNLYFDQDKVRLVNHYQHKDPETQKAINGIYHGRKNKKLANLITDKSVGYYVMNMDGKKYFDLLYRFLENESEEKYQKEINLIVETMKIALDEDAIAKIAPGNGIFVLNELKFKSVEYTDYTYDDDYNEKEVKKTKDVVTPDFVLAFATENEKYWNRVFNVLVSGKEFSKYFSKDRDFFVYKEKNGSGIVDQLYFTVKNGIVYLTTSKENINAQTESKTAKQWMKDSSKYALSGRLDFKKLLSGLDKEFKSKKEKETLNVLSRKAGEVYFRTESKNNSIQSEISYTTEGSSENSLMYFFDLFDELYKIFETEKKNPTL